MRKTIILVISSLICGFASCKNNHSTDNHSSIEIVVTIHDVYKDSIYIECTPKGIRQDSILLKFPKVIPGTYRKNNAEEYISCLKGYDHNSNEIEIKKIDGNTYLIPYSSKLDKISYYAKKGKENSEYDLLTKVVTTDSFFIINPVSIIGYFEGYQHAKYTVELENHSGFSTAFISEKVVSERGDCFKFDNYEQVTETPLFYSNLDTITLHNNAINANITVYSDNKNITASLLSKWIEPLLHTLNEYTSTVRDNKIPYRFVFIFSKNLLLTSALEKADASVYCMGANNDTIFLRTPIQHFVAHEFLHTITPIKFHSNLYHEEKFENYTSKHLWLYEGIVEYLAIKARLESKQMTLEEFFYHLSMSYYLLEENKNCSQMGLSDISKNILAKNTENCFDKFYRKGCILGFCLDFAISKCNGGTDNLISIINKYIKENGTTFDENNFIQNFLSADCLNSFDIDISDNELKALFNTVLYELGYKFTKEKTFWPSSLSFSFHVDKYHLDKGDIYVSFDNNSILKGKTIQLLKIDGQIANEEILNKNLIYPANFSSKKIEYLENNMVKTKILNLGFSLSEYQINEIKQVEDITSSMKDNRNYLFGVH